MRILHILLLVSALPSLARAQQQTPISGIASDGSVISQTLPLAHNCLFSKLGRRNGIDASECHHIVDLNLGPGFSYGSSQLPGQAGWATSHTLWLEKITYQPGISQNLLVRQQANKVGDVAGIYGYIFGKGGCTAPADECIEPMVMQGGEDASAFAGKFVSRTGDNLTLTPTQDRDNPASGSYLLDLRTPVVKGHITAENPSNWTLTSAEPVTPSTGIGLTTTPVTIVSNPPNGNPAEVTVRVSSGTFVKAGVITFACGDFTDTIYPTSVTALAGGQQTISGVFRYSHSTPCAVYQGGSHGSLDLVADRRTPSGGNLLRTSYQIVGATDAHTLVYRHFVQGSLQSLPAGAHNFGLSLRFLIKSRQSGVVRACLTGNNADAITKFDGEPIRVAAEVTELSGTFTGALDPDPSCIQWRQRGPDKAAGALSLARISTGGTVGALGAYAIWPSAEVNSMTFTVSTTQGVTTPHFTGQLHVVPNDVAWSAGDPLEQPHHPSVMIQMLGLNGFFNTPSTHSPNMSLAMDAQGVGVDGNYQHARWENKNPTNMYMGYGGHLQYPALLNVTGLWGVQLAVDAPARGGSAHYIRKPPSGCKDPSRDFYDIETVETFNYAFHFTINCATNVMTWQAGGHTYTWSPAGLSTDAPITTPALTLTSGNKQYRLTVVNGALSLQPVN